MYRLPGTQIRLHDLTSGQTFVLCDSRELLRPTEVWLAVKGFAKRHGIREDNLQHLGYSRSIEPGCLPMNTEAAPAVGQPEFTTTHRSPIYGEGAA